MARDRSVGAPNSRFQNDTAGPLTITVNPGTTASGIDLDAGIILSSSGANPNFVLTGFGVTRLTNSGNTANLLVKNSYLRVDDVTSGPSGFGALGTGSLTFENGILRYAGTTTATLAKPFVLAAPEGLGSVGVVLQNASAGTAELTADINATNLTGGQNSITLHPAACCCGLRVSEIGAFRLDDTIVTDQF